MRQSLEAWGRRWWRRQHRPHASSVGLAAWRSCTELAHAAWPCCAGLDALYKPVGLACGHKVTLSPSHPASWGCLHGCGQV